MHTYACTPYTHYTHTCTYIHALSLSLFLFLSLSLSLSLSPSLSLSLSLSLSPTQKMETLVSSLDVKMLDQISINGIQAYFTSWFAGASTTVNRCHAWPIRASCIAWHCACCRSGGRSCTVNTRRDSTTAATYCATVSSTGMAGLWRS